MGSIPGNSEVVLFLSASELVPGDFSPRLDPYAIIYVEGCKVATTKPIVNTCCPVWKENIRIFFLFEKLQQVRIELWNAVDSDQHEALGHYEFALGNLMKAKGASLTASLLTKNPAQGLPGNITIHGEQGRGNKTGSLEFQLNARNLSLRNWIGLIRCDPFFVISRNLEDSLDTVTVYQSESRNHTNNPKWNSTTCDLKSLCLGDLTNKITIAVYDHHKEDSKQLIGSVSMTVEELIESDTRRFALIGSSKRKVAGSIGCSLARVKMNPTTRSLEYLVGGLEITTMFAVDFSASNGDPRHPRSLHHRGGLKKMSAYQEAIHGVGSIMQEYNSGKQFKCFGFGASIDGKPSNCFALNGNERKPSCTGIDGVLQAYENAFNFASLAGPTNFSPVIEVVKKLISVAAVTQEYQHYTVLVILTDGGASDMEATIASIVSASRLPMSIIITGVGNDSFDDMVYLDADNVLLKDSNGVVAERDIVQFAKFAGECDGDGTALAKETLAELPRNIVDFFESKGITPNPPPINTHGSTENVLAPP